MAEIIVVGASTGGMAALSHLLGKLKSNFKIPLVVVLHRGKDSTVTLSTLLQTGHRIRVVEAEDKQPIQPGHIYLGPSNYHLLAEYGELQLSVDPPVLYARPSIDVLFESAAYAYGDKVLGVLLTGASEDGAHGLMKIHLGGGQTLVQEPGEAEAKIMPQAAIARFKPDKVLPVAGIADTLNGL